MNKKILGLVILFSLIGGAVFVYKKTGVMVTNYDECVAAGNPVMESYPQQCRHNGTTFTQDISSNDSDNTETNTSADNAPPGSIHNLPVPEAVSAVKAYAIKNEGLDSGSTIVLSVTEKDWSDSCLGLGGPAESCLAAITPGYEVVIKANKSEITYRTNKDGSEIRQDM